MSPKQLLALLLTWLAVAFFVWDALRSAGVPGGAWLLPGGLAAGFLAFAIERT